MTKGREHCSGEQQTRKNAKSQALSVRLNSISNQAFAEDLCAICFILMAARFTFVLNDVAPGHQFSPAPADIPPPSPVVPGHTRQIQRPESAARCACHPQSSAFHTRILHPRPRVPGNPGVWAWKLLLLWHDLQSSHSQRLQTGLSVEGCA